MNNPPWELPNDCGEWPGEICCQRAGGYCWEHDPKNYPVVLRAVWVLRRFFGLM